MVKKKEFIPDYISITLIVLLTGVLSFFAIGLPEKICLINGYESNCNYGIWASYFTIILFSYIIFYNIKLTKHKTRPSISERINIYLRNKRLLKERRMKHYLKVQEEVW